MFSDQYTNFMEAVRTGLRQTLNVDEHEYSEGRSTAARLLRSMFDTLLSPDAVETINCIARQNMSQQGLEALGLELQFLADREFNPENAGTAKDSIEELIGELPGWIREPLHVLNEILKIVGRAG